MALLVVWRFQKIASQTKLESYWCPVIYREATIQISPINVKASIKRVHVSWQGCGGEESGTDINRLSTLHCRVYSVTRVGSK